MRIHKPPGGGFAVLHAKSIVIDRRTLLTGSVNLTHNGFENNLEHMFKINVQSTVQQVLQHFEDTWNGAEIVDQEKIDEMLRRKDEKKEEQRKRGASRSRSLSVERGTSRSLSSDFANVALATVQEGE